MGCRIKAISSYLPENILHNSVLERDFPEWTSEKIESKTGIKERHVVREGETALDLAIRACEKVLVEYDRDAIDFLLLCTQSPDYFLPTTACILQNRLKFRTSIGALDYNLGCSGYVYGLALAKSLVNGGMANRILLVMSETYSKYIHPKDKSNRTIFGDGASATIIEHCEEESIFEFVFGTDGRGYENLIVQNGGLRHRYDPDAPEKDDGFGNIRTDNNLFMNGAEIFAFTLNSVPKLVDETLARNRISLNELDYVIFHQANKFMLDHLRKKISIPEEKFYLNLSNTGNTVSSTIPIALEDCLNKGTIVAGDKVLLVGFGVGYSWSATVVEL